MPPFAQSNAIDAWLRQWYFPATASVTEIDRHSFAGCTSLSSVEFGGTMAQWEAVEKGDGWHKDVPAKSVKCSDGEAEL